MWDDYINIGLRVEKYTVRSTGSTLVVNKDTRYIDTFIVDCTAVEWRKPSNWTGPQPALHYPFETNCSIGSRGADIIIGAGKVSY